MVNFILFYYYFIIFVVKFFHRFAKNIFVKGTFCCKFPDFLKKLGDQKSPQLLTI
jgi:hypothetical protein